jgi:hypothetical protein
LYNFGGKVIYFGCNTSFRYRHMLKPKAFKIISPPQQHGGFGWKFCAGFSSYSGSWSCRLVINTAMQCYIFFFDFIYYLCECVFRSRFFFLLSLYCCFDFAINFIHTTQFLSLSLHNAYEICVLSVSYHLDLHPFCLHVFQHCIAVLITRRQLQLPL